jgi:hypothetical protein
MAAEVVDAYLSTLHRHSGLCLAAGLLHVYAVVRWGEIFRRHPRFDPIGRPRAVQKRGRVGRAIASSPIWRTYKLTLFHSS